MVEVCGAGERWPVVRWFPQGMWWHAVDSDDPPRFGSVVTALCGTGFVVELMRATGQRASCPWCVQQVRAVRGMKVWR